MKFLFLICTLICTSTLFSQTESVPLSWPREIDTNHYIITVYQPQLETLNGNILKGQLALSIKDTIDSEITFGSMWFEARLLTDLENRTAILNDLRIKELKFPGVSDSNNLTKIKSVIIENFISSDHIMSLDRIISSVQSISQVNTINNDLNNLSPHIYLRSTPTVLINIDGDPIFKESSNEKIELVVNSPYFIARKKDKYYIKGGKKWYTSNALLGENWKSVDLVSNDLNKVAEKQLGLNNNVDDEGASVSLIVVSEPSELIYIEGKATYTPIQNTALLFVNNTESDILMDLSSQKHYLLISGRWYYTSKLTDDDWKFQEPSKLPTDFQNISDSSEVASVLISVPGTKENQESIYEQQVPQTAIVDRATASVNVEYDGNPKFEEIEGTNLLCAINSNVTVLNEGDVYYAIDSAVWFVSGNEHGPWAVCINRPEEVDQIPPTSPVYNVKYVYIYESTPDVVYVGYTAGYYHSYMYNGVIVYGTGYYYQPWYGHHYYPRPATYGYGVHYNPYSGWGFSAGVSYGWLTVSHHNYWGPAGYRHGYRHGYHSGYHRGYHNGYSAGYARGVRNSNNIYRNRSNGVHRTSNNRYNGNRNPSMRPSNKPNNVYSDRKGNVHKRDNNGSWNRVNNTPSKPKPRVKPNTQSNLNRSYNSRTRGTNNYNQQRNKPAPRTPNRAAVRGGGRGGRR